MSSRKIGTHHTLNETKIYKKYSRYTRYSYTMSTIIWSNNMHMKCRSSVYTFGWNKRAIDRQTQRNENNRRTKPTKGQKTKVHHLFYRCRCFSLCLSVGRSFSTNFSSVTEAFLAIMNKKSKADASSRRKKYQMHAFKKYKKKNEWIDDEMRMGGEERQTEKMKHCTVYTVVNSLVCLRRRLAFTGSSSFQFGRSLIFPNNNRRRYISSIWGKCQVKIPIPFPSIRCWGETVWVVALHVLRTLHIPRESLWWRWKTTSSATARCTRYDGDARARNDMSMNCCPISFGCVSVCKIEQLNLPQDPSEQWQQQRTDFISLKCIAAAATTAATTAAAITANDMLNIVHHSVQQLSFFHNFFDNVLHKSVCVRVFLWDSSSLPFVFSIIPYKVPFFIRQ